MTPDDDDDFRRGYHGAPSRPELQAMTDLELFEKLTLAAPGSVKFMALEAEKRRRDAPPKSWGDSILAKVLIGVASGTVVLLIGTYFVLK